jgi:hypothetical protein
MGGYLQEAQNGFFSKEAAFNDVCKHRGPYFRPARFTSVKLS